MEGFTALDALTSHQVFETMYTYHFNSIDAILDWF